MDSRSACWVFFMLCMGVNVFVSSEQFRRDDHYVVLYLLCRQVVIGVDVCWSGGDVPQCCQVLFPQNLILRQTGLETYDFILPLNLWFHLPRFLMGVLFRAMGFEKLLIWRINVKWVSGNHLPKDQLTLVFLNGRKCCTTWDVHNPVNLGILRWILSTWYLG